MKAECEQKLLSQLSVSRKISLKEAMDLLDISESTARRLFARLERAGCVIRTHGGIQSITPEDLPYSFEALARTNVEKKTAIGRAAVDFVEDGDVLFCDSGTTIQCFCAALAQRLQSQPLHIQVYTNSLANLEMLAPYMSVHLVGGEYRANRKDFCGALTEKTLRSLSFTKSFFGADGCVQGTRLTATDRKTAKLNEIALRNSQRTFMLVDSSKFTVSSQVAYTLIRGTHTIITDSGIAEDTIAQLNSTHVQLICVEPVPPADGTDPSL
ncbi:MAG: DeoR/GlpR transcriptional regulator [Ruminococcaceae bacterium]|nr:DeoR/GlpR transcriptional regulator [Oscillospiraceae bacterium]